MIKYKTFMHPTKFPVNWTCNMCGMVLDNEGMYGLEEWQTEYISHFGFNYPYGTPKDGTVVEFDLCIDCLEKIMAMFKIPAEEKTLFF